MLSHSKALVALFFLRARTSSHSTLFFGYFSRHARTMCVSGGEVKKKKNQAKNKIVVFTVYFFFVLLNARAASSPTHSLLVRFDILWCIFPSIYSNSRKLLFAYIFLCWERESKTNIEREKHNQRVAVYKNHFIFLFTWISSTRSYGVLRLPVADYFSRTHLIVFFLFLFVISILFLWVVVVRIFSCLRFQNFEDNIIIKKSQ